MYRAETTLYPDIMLLADEKSVCQIVPRSDINIRAGYYPANEACIQEE